MTVDVPVENYQNYLQHRPPMVWVDRVVEAGRDDEGIFGACRVVIRPGQLFLNENNQIRGTAAVEFVAQTYGFVRACYQHENKIPYSAKRTFLTGIRNCKAMFDGKDFLDNEELHVEIRTVRELQPLFFIGGRVLSSDKSIEFATAEIQLYIGE